MARPVAGFPFPCQNGSVLRQTERGNGIRPTVSDKQNIPRDASAAGRVFLPCPAGGNRLHTAAFLVEKAKHAVQLTDNGKAAVRKRDWLARPAALGQRNDLGLPLRHPSGKRETVQAAVAEIRETDSVPQRLHPMGARRTGRQELPQNPRQIRVHRKIMSASIAASENHAVHCRQMAQRLSARQRNLSQRGQRISPQIIGDNRRSLGQLGHRIQAILPAAAKRRVPPMPHACLFDKPLRRPLHQKDLFPVSGISGKQELSLFHFVSSLCFFLFRTGS